MSANAFIEEFDAAAHETFAAAGIAATGSYTPPSGGTASDRRCFVDTARQAVGDFGQVTAPRTVIGIMIVDGAVAQKGTLIVAGVTYTLQALDESDEFDGSIERWVVQHG